MAQKANVIEINGKRYDALSGKLLGDSGSAAITISKPRNNSGISMDGMVKKTAAIVQPTVVTPTVTPNAPAKLPQAVSDVVRTPGSNVQHHKLTTSKTLMRHAVTKPTASLRRQTKVQHRTDVLVKQPSITVSPKLSSYQIDPTKISRAQQTPKHPEAHRYAVPRPRPVSKTISTVQTVQPAATPVRTTPAITSPAPTIRPNDIFEQALARANSHIEKPVARKHTKHRRGLFGGRALSIGATSLAVLLLIGFFAWQQKAELTMRYAATKSGVSAKLPGYKPAGFAATKFSYSPGLVAVNFKNSSTGDSFALVEKSSSWDSQALLDSFVATKNRTYHTIDVAGRSIYTYGDNSATWVDNGVWYQVTSKGSLTTNQLVQLALSI